jgi:hypothetical protein
MKQITVYCMMICLGAHRWILCSDPLEKKILRARVKRAAFGLSSSAIFESRQGFRTSCHCVVLIGHHLPSAQGLHWLVPGATHQLFDETATKSIWSRTALIIEYGMQRMTSLLASSFA